MNVSIVNVELLLTLSIFFFSCDKQNSDPVKFADTPISKKITPGIIDEASGIADSKANTGYLWLHQDSGNPNDIFLLSYSGEVFKKINIKSSVNRDWEDMAIGPGPAAGVNYVYIADVGDNARIFSQYTIYRFPEPAATADTVSVYDVIRFEYPDGAHDAEAMLVDNNSKDIYIITKMDAASRIYKLSYPQNISGVNTAVYIGDLPFNGVVSAASSVQGDELLVKTYTSIYYWKRSATENPGQTLSKPAVKLGYQQEPQGEAICFKNDNTGFYTLSERPVIFSEVFLNFYKRE